MKHPILIQANLMQDEKLKKIRDSFLDQSHQDEAKILLQELDRLEEVMKMKMKRKKGLSMIQPYMSPSKCHLALQPIP